MLVQMDARSVFSTIFRQIWKLIIISAPIVLIALLYVLFATPTYESSARLLVKFGQDARPDMQVGQGGGGLSSEDKRGLIQSNVNILISRDLAETLINKVGAEKAYPDLAKDSKTPEIAKLRAQAQFMTDLSTKTESGAGTIDIKVANEDPKAAKLLLEELISQFISRQSEIYGNPQADVIREQTTEAYNKLEEANAELFKYKSKVGVASIDEEMSMLLKQRSDIAGYLSTHQSTDPNAGELIATENGEIILEQPDETTIIPAKRGDGANASGPYPALDEIQTRIDGLRSKELELLQTYKPNSSIITNIRNNIQAESELLSSSVQALQSKIAELDARIAEMNEYKSVYDSLVRKVGFAEDIYKTAKMRLQAAEVNSDLNDRKITQITVVEQPNTPLSPSNPKKVLILFLAIVIGGTFGVAAALISELLDLKFSYPEQLTSHFKEPLLASFSFKAANAKGEYVSPSYWNESVKKVRGMLPASWGLTVPPSAPPALDRKILSPRSMAALFQSMAAQMPGSDKKIVFVASSYEGEGATRIAWELAQFITGTIKKNTLFIGYDDAVSRPSLLDVARGKASASAAVSEVARGEAVLSVAHLSRQDEITSLLASLDEVSRVLGSVKANFDYVVVATPAVLSKSAHVALSRSADGVLFVIEAERTRAPVVKQALQSLKNSGANVAGVILNKRFYYIPKWLYRHL